MQVEETVFRDRSLEEEERACPSRLHCARDGALTAHHDHFWFRVQLLEPSQQLNAVNVRQGEISQDDIRPPLFEDFGAVCASPSSSNVVTFWPNDGLEQSCHRALFINSQYAATPARRE